MTIFPMTSNRDFEQLKEALDTIDWSSLLPTGTLDEMLSVFYDKLYTVLDDIVPRKRRTFDTRSSKPWWSPELRHLRNILRKARHRYFNSKSESDRDHLRAVEQHYEAELSSAYNRYLSRIQSSVKEDPSYFWDFVRKRQASSGIPGNIMYNELRSNTH